MPFIEDLPRDIRARRKRRGPRMNSRVPVTIEEEEVSNAPLHHSPLRFSTFFYNRPLCPTCRHMISVFRTLSRENIQFVKKS